MNKKGKVLYVGKAKNLKLRLKSYRQVPDQAVKTKKMLDESESVKYKATDSEIEALLIEAELIKLYQPRFNILLKDDKSPLYIAFTKEEYPRVIATRKNKLPATYFGPYPSAYQTKRLLSWLRHLFPFCNTTQTQKRQKKACFYYHIKLCPGACIGEISPKDYQKNLDKIKLLLKGKKFKLISQLKKEIKILSEKQKYEQAAQLRDRLIIFDNLRQQKSVELDLPFLEQDIAEEQTKHLRRLLKPVMALPSDYPLTRIEAYDVSNISGKQATGSMVVFVNGKPQKDQYRLFKIKTVKKPNDPAMIKEIIKRRVKRKDWQTPNLIVIDGGITQLKAALSVISWRVPIIGIAKHPDKLVAFNHNTKETVRFRLPQKNPATKLIQHLRDESHRFAKNYHKNLRQRQFFH